MNLLPSSELNLFIFLRFDFAQKNKNRRKHSQVAILYTALHYIEQKPIE